MLSEHLNGMYEAGEPPERMAAIQKSFAQHLLAAHDGQRVRLFLVRRAIPAPDAVAKGQALDDRALYQERLLGEYAGAAM
jgi:hypothetical protein